MKLDIPKFDTKKETFKFLVDNKQTLINQKKSAIKYADGIGCNIVSNSIEATLKSIHSISNKDELAVLAAINTTNIMDSHDDVHFKGIWKKSLSENKRMLHVQEHKSNEFDKIISSGSDLKAFTELMRWKELGFNANGITEVLLFDSLVKRSRNPFMFKQYSSKFVDNHSVGMFYIKLDLAVNDKEFPEEFEFFEKHIDDIINKQDAIDQGFFWGVSEAKAIEGSAVPLGSNPVTPTLNVESKELKQMKVFKNFLNIE